jgi:2-keto-4-pentenoate hydratase/2-oxohepta-3-ene-1,7-dioic acid hydratase in catechol pathway
MKLLLFDNGRPGILTDAGVVDIDHIVSPLISKDQSAMEALITNFEQIKEALVDAGKNGPVIPLSKVTIEAPLPHPEKILCMGGNFTEFGHRAQAPMWGFLKSSEAILGPEGTVRLPPDDANIFHHEAELVIVFGKAGQHINPNDAFTHVFGYTCGVDVSARMPPVPGAPPPAFQPWRGVSTPKSFPTFAPLGPVIVTKDEIPDPQNLQVKLSVNEELRGDFNTSDMAHSISESIAFISSHESFKAGDLMYTGTNHQGLGAMQDGDSIRIEIESVGAFSFSVQDDLKRKWKRGVDEETAEDIRQGTGAPGRRQRPI